MRNQIKKQVVYVIGEVLIDIFPDYQRIGGAPFNFAYHLKKMGVPVRFFTRIGEDLNGKRILELLKGSGFNEADVQIDPQYPTGTVNVDLDDQGVPQFNIRDNVAYDHMQLDFLADSNQKDVRMIYFGTLVQRSDHNYFQIRRFLSRKTVYTDGFCDLNLRSPHVNFNAIETCLHFSDILKLNDSELIFLKEYFQGPDPIDAYVNWLMTRFTIKAVALTKGSQGSVLYRPSQIIHSKPVQCTIKDTVGAGDGFAAVLALCWMKGITPRSTIELASEFASTICSIEGAVPNTDEVYDSLMNQIEGDAYA